MKWNPSSLSKQKLLIMLYHRTILVLSFVDLFDDLLAHSLA
jgi:hypothetical protein